ncbi:PAS domain-containing sensor histidine kinase [Ekhidna sp.]
MTTWKDRIEILHLEDNPDDIDLLSLTLKRSNLDYQLKSISTKEDFEKEDLTHFDVVISDYNLKNYDGLSAIKRIRELDSTKPVILLSGTVGEELATDLLRAGANDFILKSNLKKIPIAIERALHECSMSKEKQKFQRELVEKNLILDTIFDSFADMIFLKNNDGEYLKVNKAFCDFFKVHADEIVGKKEEEIFPENISDKAIENDEFVKFTGKSVAYEIDFIHDGSRKIIEITKTPIIDEGEVDGIVGECRDITKQKTSLEETIKAKSILSQAELLTRSGSFEYDADLDVLSCSGNFKRMMNLNIEGDKISFRKFSQLIKEEDRDIFAEGINRCINKHEEYHSEHRFNINQKDDSIIGHFKVVLRPDYKDDKGVRYYGTVVDVTADHENQIYQMNKQERDRKDLARELHDNLGQKMNGISMFISQISDNTPDNKGLLKVKNLVHETIDDLGYLINNISVKQIEEHSLDYAIDKLIGYMPESITVKSDYKITEDELSPFVKSQIYRVIQETLNNVAKYSEASEVKMDLHQDGGIVSLNIEDDGVGFAVDQVLNGNGLQNITHRVRHSNGLVNIDSQKGKGTRVTVKMPVS